MRPRTGTLEWIALYDRPQFSLCRQAKRFSIRDAIVFSLLLVWTMVCVAAALVLIYRGQTLSSNATLLLLVLAGMVDLSASLLPGYLLLRRLTGRTGLSVAGCAILFANCALSSCSAPGVSFFLLCADYLLLCWLDADPDVRRPAAGFALIFSLVALVLAFANSAAAVWALPGWMILWLVGLVTHFRRTSRPGRCRRLVGSILLTLFAAALFVTVLLGVTGALASLQLPELFLVPLQYYASIIAAQPALLLSADHLAALSEMFALPFLWWGGLFAFCAAIAMGISRRDPRPLFLVFCAVGTLPLWVVTGAPAGPFFAAAALTLVWDGALARGRTLLVWPYIIVAILSGVLSAIFTLLVF